MSKMKITGITTIAKALVKGIELKEVPLIVRKHAGDLQESAQRLAPVRAVHGGTLKRSIEVEIMNGGMSAEIAPHTDYEVYQEFGTRFQEGTPYMRPSLKKIGPLFVADLKKLMK